MANDIDRVLRRTRKTLKRQGCYIDYKWDYRKGKGSHGVVTMTHDGKSTDMIFSTTRGIDSGQHIRGAVKRQIMIGLTEIGVSDNVKEVKEMIAMRVGRNLRTGELINPIPDHTYTLEQYIEHLVNKFVAQSSEETNRHD